MECSFVQWNRERGLGHELQSNNFATAAKRRVQMIQPYSDGRHKFTHIMAIVRSFYSELEHKDRQKSSYLFSLNCNAMQPLLGNIHWRDKPLRAELIRCHIRSYIGMVDFLLSFCRPGAVCQSVVVL